MDKLCFYRICLLVFFTGNAIAQVKDSVFIKQLVDSALRVEFLDNKLAQRIAGEALSLSEKNGYPRFTSKSLVVLGYLQDDIGNFNEAKKYYNRSLEINLKNNSKKQIALDYSNLGLNAENSGDFPDAIEWHNQALQLRIEISDTSGIAASNNNIGNIYGRQGDNTKALNYFLKSLKIIEQRGDENKLPPQLNNVAIIYIRLHNYEKAIDYYSRALMIWKKNNDKDGMATVTRNISKVHMERKEYDKALAFVNESLRLNLEIENKPGVGECYNMTGSIYSTLKQYQKALDYFQKALAIELELNDKSEICIIYANLASLYIETNQIDKALVNLDLALPLAKENRLMTQLKDIYKFYYQAYKVKSKYDLSLKYHELYFAINDSVYNIESTKQLNELNTRYETEKKEKENKLLQIENDLSGKTIKQQKTVFYFIILGLLLLVAFTIFIFKSLKQQRKANHVISIQKQEVEIKRHEIEKQKHVIEEHQKEMVDSINYAKRIQYALLAQEGMLKQNLSDYFVLFNPKDIVSGDFYWSAEHDGKFYLAVCDSTGHGVPGAFMSLLNMGFLTEAIKEKKIEEPHDVFNYVRQRLMDSIGADGQRDGMDAILLCIDKQSKTVSYAAANNEPVLIRKGQIMELPKDKMPVGKGERMDSFTLQVVAIEPGDVLYLYTDGYADQFGGPKGKKFKYKSLNESLLAMCKHDVNKQKALLEHQFTDWKGNLEQVDDVLLIGIKM
ncbi:MAG: yrrB 5 [Bacteroidetes bacterium]|jgi:tetratricopeptide (TPR) repeat protein|nr:yrrB 5 [Bacteroidota bacterium]